MVKIMELLPPRAGLTPQEFHDHWRHPHGTIARNVRQVRRYIQNHCVHSNVLGKNATPYEGIGEGWFDTIEDCMALAEMPYMLETIFPDEERFLDRPGIKIMFADEEVIASGPHKGVKVRPTTETSAYDLEWSPNHGGPAIRLFQFIEQNGTVSWDSDDDENLGHMIGALRHIRSRPAMTPAPFIGVRELWWPTLTAFERGITREPAAWAKLRDRPKSSFCLLALAERQL